ASNPGTPSRAGDLQYARERALALLGHAYARLEQDGLDAMLLSVEEAAQLSPIERWWAAVIVSAADMLDGIAGPRTPLQGYQLYDPRDVERVDLLVAQSMLWAVHLRLETQRRRGLLTPACEELLARIQEQVAKSFDEAIEEAGAAT